MRSTHRRPLAVSLDNAPVVRPRHHLPRADRTPAADQHCRRIERDLHDVAQQRWSPLGLPLRAAHAAGAPSRRALGRAVLGRPARWMDLRPRPRVASLRRSLAEVAPLRPALKTARPPLPSPVDFEFAQDVAAAGVLSMSASYYVFAEA